MVVSAPLSNSQDQGFRHITRPGRIWNRRRAIILVAEPLDDVFIREQLDDVGEVARISWDLESQT